MPERGKKIPAEDWIGDKERAEIRDRANISVDSLIRSRPLPVLHPSINTYADLHDVSSARFPLWGDGLLVPPRQIAELIIRPTTALQDKVGAF